MINLIPPQGASLVRREYLMRVTAVWFILLTCVVVVVALTLIPTYVLLQARGNALSVAYTHLQNDDEEVYQSAQKSIQDANALAAELNRSGASVKPSHILARVRGTVPADVSLGGFTYGYDGTALSVEISGTASTREALVRFRDGLERDPLITDAAVPVASLAKDVDVPFTMTLTIADAP